MYKLYDGIGTGGACVHAALEQIGAAYEKVLVDTEKSEQKSDWFTKINPRQQVPALVLDDGTAMTESAAMLLYLADAHPEAGLMGTPGTSARASTMRWIVFISANIYEGLLREYYADRYIDDPALAGNVTKSAVDFLKRNYKILEEAAAGGPFFSGDSMTIVDIYLWMLLQWWDYPDWLTSECPKLCTLVEAVKTSPKIGPVHKIHFG